MPLTVRTNGSGGSNIIGAAWFNDYHDLLTGIMQDQKVTIKNVVALPAIGAAPSSALAGAVVSGSGLGIGAYTYVYTYATPDGETAIAPPTAVTTTTGNQKVNLTGITTGPTGTTKRNIYRTAVGGGTTYKFLATLADNTTTTYTDTTADSALGFLAPLRSTFGGTLLTQDASGNTRFQVTSDGAVLTNTVLQSNPNQTPTSPASTAPTAGGSMGVGAYQWAYTWALADGGETLASSTTTQTTTSSNKTVVLTIPVGPAGTTARNIYRTQVGASTLYYLTTINDNSTTSYSDSAADGSLTLSRQPLAHQTFGGALTVKDGTGAPTLQISGDGTITTNLTVAGTTYLAAANVYGTLTIQSSQNLIVTGGKIGKTTAGDILDQSGNDLHLKAAATASTIWFEIPSGTFAAHINASGLILNGGKLGINADGDIIDASGTTTYVKGPSAVTFQVPSGTSIFSVNGGGGDFLGHACTMSKTNFTNGSITGFTTFTGTGTGTYNHNCGAAPTWVAPIVNVSGSATQGFDTVTSTQSHVTLGASLAFTAVAYR